MLSFMYCVLVASTVRNFIFKKALVHSSSIYQKYHPVVSGRFTYYFPWRHLSTSITMACCGTGCGIDLSKDALKQRLTAQQYQVTQEKDTERPYSGKYCKHFEKGIYTCIVCNQDLFSSESKYDSKCGWPAFFDTVNSSCIKHKDDLSHDMKRTEAICSKCGAHLGHVFDDGPKPTGKRYCINSASLEFRKAEESSIPDSSS